MSLLHKEELAEKAGWVRSKVLEMCVNTRSGHIASSFSCTELLVALYYGKIIRYDKTNTSWEKRDRFIMSKGHGAIALYPILADLGFFPVSELDKFCQSNGILGVHPDNNIPGIEIVTGSLGHGLGIAGGLALRAKLDGSDYLTIALLGDGECYEGSIWEAAMFASHHQLSNLTGIIDRNGLTVTDFTERAMKLEPLQDKWQAFGWEAVTIDGHSFDEIFTAFTNARARASSKPLMIIANTVKGKGLSFMENEQMSHTMVPTGEQAEIAMRELNLRADQRHVGRA